MIAATSNPAMGVFTSAGGYGSVSSNTMSLQGTALKAGTLALLTLVSFGLNWGLMTNPDSQGLGVILGIAGSLIGFVLALVLSFWMSGAPILSPLYALCEGCFLAAVSFGFEQRYPGIAFEAAGLTILTVFSMAGLYFTGIIQVNQTFRACVCGATMGIALFYMVGGLLSLFGVHLPGLGFHADALSIIVSLVVVVVAALNLALDFDTINRGSGNLPKYMEWYGAFALLVTIVWLYIEMLRLLALVAQASQRR